MADLEIQKGGSATGAQSAPANFGVVTPTSGTLEVRTEYLEATLGLVKCLEISKELIRECVTMPGCCCCMPLLHNHLMDSCSCVRKNTLLAAKGGCICTPLTPPESATVHGKTLKTFHLVEGWFLARKAAWAVRGCSANYSLMNGCGQCHKQPPRACD